MLLKDITINTTGQSQIDEVNIGLGSIPGKIGSAFKNVGRDILGKNNKVERKSKNRKTAMKMRDMYVKNGPGKDTSPKTMVRWLQKSILQRQEDVDGNTMEYMVKNPYFLKLVKKHTTSDVDDSHDVDALNDPADEQVGGTNPNGLLNFFIDFCDLLVSLKSVGQDMEETKKKKKKKKKSGGEPNDIERQSLIKQLRAMSDEEKQHILKAVS